MVADYYIQTELVIEYLNKNGSHSIIYTDRNVSNRYVNVIIGFNPNDDTETFDNKFRMTVDIHINKNKYNKILFENNDWLAESYKLTYENRIKNDFKEINKLIKIYIKSTSWKRN